MEEKKIPYLKRGDTVALAAPARAVTPEEMAPAIETLQSYGLRVAVPDGLYERDGQLAGSDAHRAALMQRLLDDPSVAAIVCCRGGYGTVRIVDRLDFTAFAARPKWIVGYSDITVLHSHIHTTLGLPTLHATMPIDFPADKSITTATASLMATLLGMRPQLEWDADTCLGLPPEGLDITAPIVGGNLSILYSLLGSRSQMETRGKVLLIEDLDEYIYHVDRMMQALARAGMLDGLAALVVGGLNNMHDNTIPFGRTALQTVLDAAAGRGYPVLCDAPFGHLGQGNLALPLGVPMKIICSNSKKVRIFAP